MINTNNLIGFKGFDIDENNNLKCRDMIFKVGEISEIKGELIICNNGIHFCWNINDIHQYYDLREKVICEVKILGDIVNVPDMTKSCTNKLKVMKILTKEDIFNLVNIGKENTGLFNSGDWNSGDWNSGYMNSGDRNSGDRNSGDWNSGDRNSGDMNSGYWNSGDRNSGDMNSGDRNSGDRNSGDRNSGDRNSGDKNSGYMNSGDWNSGILSSLTPKAMIFNIITDFTMTEFLSSEYYSALSSEPLILNEWINYTSDEIEHDKSKDLIGGYLKTYEYKDACAIWWEKLSNENKEIIKTIPNFDAEIFEEITGIKV